MLSSGIKRLDELLGGGVEEGKIILIETIAGLGDLLALNFVAESLRRGDRCFVILGRKRVKDVKRFLEDKGVDTSKVTMVTTSERSDRRLSLDELFLISHTIKELAKFYELWMHRHTATAVDPIRSEEDLLSVFRDSLHPKGVECHDRSDDRQAVRGR